MDLGWESEQGKTKRVQGRESPKCGPRLMQYFLYGSLAGLVGPTVYYALLYNP